MFSKVNIFVSNITAKTLGQQIAFNILLFVLMNNMLHFNLKAFLQLISILCGLSPSKIYIFSHSIFLIFILDDMMKKVKREKDHRE